MVQVAVLGHKLCGATALICAFNRQEYRYRQPIDYYYPRNEEVRLHTSSSDACHRHLIRVVDGYSWGCM